jgi:YbgC/YbaW family acyl-CoA thioester hydrolase
MFTTSITVRLQHTDAAGVLFFGSYFTLLHEAYEGYLASRGIQIRHLIQDRPYALPIVHAEADFTKPVRVGEPVSITVAVEKIGNRSYTLIYELRDGAGDTVATARTVHATIHKDTQSSIPVPEEIRNALSETER